MPRKNIKSASERTEPTELLPDFMSITPNELFQRLDWIEVEIAQLSSNAGVTERLHALRFTRAQLEATRALRSIMELGPEPMGPTPP